MAEKQPVAIVVDDHPLVRMDASQILEEAGFTTFDAEDAEAAMELLVAHEGEVALLFTDVEMPGPLDGFALAHLVAERWSEVGVLVASGRRTPADGELPDQAMFVPKPFSAAVVRDRLQVLLPDGAKPAALRAG